MVRVSVGTRDTYLLFERGYVRLPTERSNYLEVSPEAICALEMRTRFLVPPGDLVTTTLTNYLTYLTYLTIGTRQLWVFDRGTALTQSSYIFV